MTSNDLPQGTAQNTISLMLGHPDPATLLTPELRHAMQHAISSPQFYTALQYGAEQGAQSLINFLVEKINREQDLSIQPANLILVEAPTYADALHVFRDHQIELCSIPMDEDGLIPSALEKEVARLSSSGKSPSFLYSIPN